MDVSPPNGPRKRGRPRGPGAIGVMPTTVHVSSGVAAPCVSCGTTGGQVLVSGRQRKPNRYRADRFGGEGVLCPACREKEVDLVRSMDDVGPSPEELAGRAALCLEFLSGRARPGDEAEDRRIGEIEYAPGAKPGESPREKCRAILSDWRKRFGRPGRERWVERFTGKSNLSAEAKSLRRCWRSNVESARDCHGEESLEYRDALSNPATCLLCGGHDGPHRYTMDGDMEFVFGEPATARGRVRRDGLFRGRGGRP